MTKSSQRSKEEVAEVINSLLVAHKFSLTTGMSISQLNNEYIEQDGTSIPFRDFGYPCLMDFLISLQRMKKIVIGKRGRDSVVFPCVDSKIAHVSALVSKQKNSGKRQTRGGGRPPPSFWSFPRTAPPRPPKLDSQTLTDVLKHIRTAPNGVHINRIMEYLKDRDICDVDKQTLKSQLFDVSHEVLVEYDTVYPIMKKHESPRPIINKKITNSMNGHATESKSAVTMRPAGDTDSDDDCDEAFDFVTLASKAECTEEPPPKPVKVDNEPHEQPAAVEPPVDENANVPHRDDENSNVTTEDDIGILVHNRTRFRLEKLIQQHPNGIWCAELPAIYHNAYGIPLSYEDLGFGSVSDFAAHLPDIFYCVRLQDKGDFKLFNAKAPKPQTKESARPQCRSLASLHDIYQSYYDESEAVPVTLSPATTLRLVPDGVMTIGETVAQIYVTELFPNVQDYVEVVVVDVYTPTFFWIHILKRTPSFRRFMVDLHDFYSVNASKYVIPVIILEKGLNCACIYDDKWHRAVIKSVKFDNSVTVLFYDYGTVMTYLPEKIHFLHRRFSSLPAQAIPCGLYNVKPKSSEKWSYAICKEFVAKVLDVPLVAMLGSIDVDNNSMLIALTNTEGDTDLHINDWMVSAGYAIYGKMVCIRPPNYPFRRFLECARARKTDRQVERNSKFAKILTIDETIEVPKTSASVTKKTVGDLSFYNALLRMHRKSASNHSQPLINADNIELRVPSEKSRVFHAASSQPAEKTISDVVTTFYADATDPLAVQNQHEASRSRHESYRPNLLKKLVEMRANRIAAMSVGSSDNGSKSSKSPSTGATSSSVSVVLPDCESTNVEAKKLTQNSNSTRRLMRNACLASLAARSKETRPRENSRDNNALGGGGENAPAEPTKSTPLHLRSELPERRKDASEFGAIYSSHGGHGRMERIDWESLRSGERSGNASDALAAKQSPRNVADTSPERISARHLSVLRKNRNSTEKLNTLIDNFEYSMGSIKTPPPSARAEKPKPVENAPTIPETAEPEMNDRINSYRAMPEIEKKKDSTERRRKNREKDAKALMNRYQWLLKSEQQISLISSSREITQQEAKASPSISSATPESSPSTSVFSKLPPSKRAFLDYVTKCQAEQQQQQQQQELPEFGDFHSKFGGNGRMEPINWNECRKVVVDSPVRVQVSSRETSKFTKEMPVELKPARKGFLNVVNSGLPSLNERDSLCVPEGNVVQQAQLSPLLRTIVRDLDRERRAERLRLFVSNDIAELLRGDSDSSSLFSSETKSFEVDDGETMGSGLRIKSSVKYQILDKASTSVERSSSETVAATTVSEFSPTNYTSVSLDSSNEAAVLISSANATKSADELLKLFDRSSMISCGSSTAGHSNDDSRGRTTVAPSEAIAVAENIIDTKFETVRPVVNGTSRSSLQNLVTNDVAADDDKLFSDDQAESLHTTAEQSPNASIRNAFFKLNSTLLQTLFKSLEAPRDSTDDSLLDSDDASCDKGTKNEDSLSASSSARVNGNSMNEGFGKSCDSDDVPSTSYEESRASEERAGKSTIDEHIEELTNSDDFENVKNSDCSKSFLESVQKYPAVCVACYDDTCIDNDSDKWDYSLGRGEVLQSVEEQLGLRMPSLNECVDENSDLDRFENRLTWERSNSHENNSGKDEKNDAYIFNLASSLLKSSAQQNRDEDTSNL